MPGIDASIPLGYKQPDQMQNLSSLLNVAKGSQELENQGITLQERKAMQQVLANPSNYTDEAGAFDLGKAQAAIMKAAPTTGAKYMADLSAAHTSALQATRTLNTLTAENRSQIGGVLASLPADAPTELVHKTVDALNEQFGGRLGPLVKVFKQGYEQAAKKGPDAASQFVLQSARSVLPQETQQSMNTPQGPMLSNGQQSVMVNLRPGVQGVAQGAPVQGTQVQQLLPVGQQETTTSDSQGNLHVVHRDAFGNVVGTRPLDAVQASAGAPPAPGPFRLPQGETTQSMADLQGQRTAAHTAANSAPVMHDINRTIIAEASKGLTTGKLGELLQAVRSRTGFASDQVGDSNATDINILGKMLERSALTAAQSMGPHTNADLEASIRANGSLEYTPQAIKKIAHLNDAIVSGSEMYRDGLERAISGSPNGVFAKREFDTKWAKAASPQALRLKNAVDNGDKDEIESLVKEVGGKGSDGARKLHKQLTELLQLAGR